MSQSQTISKDTLQDAIQAGRLGLDELLEQIAPEDMLKPARADGWSVKDLLGHITSWEQRLLGWLAEIADGNTAQIPAKGYAWQSIDDLNEMVRQKQQSNSVEQTLVNHRASMTMLIKALEQLTDDDLNSEYFPGEPGLLWQHFAACTYEHYIEHAAQIRAWLNAGGKVVSDE